MSLENERGCLKGQGFCVFQKYKAQMQSRHEGLFFIKPEVVLAGKEAFDHTLELVLKTFEKEKITITAKLLIDSSFLKEHRLIEEHYGVIAAAARMGKSFFSKEHENKFFEYYQVSCEEEEVLGAVEFLEKYPLWNEHTLNILWENGDRKKLGGGVYVERYRIEGKNVFVINGFSPFQVSFYTSSQRHILVFTTAFEQDYSYIRQNVIGATNPFQAKKGSLRAQLLEASHGIELHAGQNGVHFSASPVEALAEMKRFLSLTMDSWDVSQTSTFMKINHPQILTLMKNESILVKNEFVKSFDFFEEKNIEDIIDFLR